MSELLGSGIVGNFKSQYVDKWNDLGFLDGIDERNKFELAYMYEIMAFYLVWGHKLETFGRRDLILEKKEINPEIYDSCNNSRFSYIIFPVIRRLFSGDGVKKKYQPFDVFHVSECFRDTIGTIDDKDWDRLKDFNQNYKIDVEAEYTVWFCEYYERVIRNKVHSRRLLIESKIHFLNFMVENNKTIVKINKWEREKQKNK